MPDKLSILFLGDIIGRPGRQAMDKLLPPLIKKYSPALVIANAENAAGGVGITEKVGHQLFDRLDVLTSGNHIWDKKEALEYLEKEPRLLRPANYPDPNPGSGAYVYVDDEGHKIAVINLQGRVFMEPIECPFRTAARLVDELKSAASVVVIDFHAEATSEKQALGWYLDGKVSAVIGTHTHVATADEKILPQGTAYISDVGMVGSYASVIGMRRDQAIKRFLTSRPQRFEPAKEGLMLSSVLVEVNPDSGKALSIKREMVIEDENGE